MQAHKNIYRQNILCWLQKRSKLELKNILTIKNKYSQQFLSKIFNLEGDKGMKLLYSISVLAADNKNLYTKKEHRYKTNKQIKNQVSQRLYNGIVVNRQNHLQVSLKMQLIEYLPQIMDTLSEKKRSLWFQICQFHSFAQCLIHFFQTEIFDAYEKRKPVSQVSPYSIWSRKFPEYKQKIYRNLQKQIFQHCLKNAGDKMGKQAEANARAEAKYQLSRFLQRIEDPNKQPFEQFVQYQWISTKEDQLYHKIMQKLYDQIDQIIQKETINIQIAQFQKFEQNDKKKKRKRGKPINKNVQNSSIVQGIIKQQQQQQLRNSNDNNEQKQSQKPQFINQEVIPEAKIQSKKVAKLEQVKNQQLFQQKLSSQVNQLQQKKQQSPIQYQKINTDLFTTNKMQDKHIKNSVSQYINIFIQSLKEGSDVYDLHRNTAISLLQKTISRMKLEFQWQLKRFGSCQADFALKQSDIDLVLLVAGQGLSLQKLAIFLRTNNWIYNCQLIPANIPILSFDVDLKLCTQQVLPQRQMKKCPILKFDLSIGRKYQTHTGIQNTKYMKDILLNNPVTKSTCYLLKQLLRHRQLNKPYSGGISSFVLVAMVNGILSMRVKQQGLCIFQQLEVITDFMVNQFIPQQTMIYSSKQSEKERKLKADHTIDLNIENPLFKGIIKTSAFKIDMVIDQLRKLQELLQTILNEVNCLNLTQKKRIKKLVLNQLEQFLTLKSNKVSKKQQ